MVTSSLIFFLSLVIILSSHGCYLCSWQPVSLLFFKYKYELSRGRRLKMTICIKNSHFLFFTERLSITCWLVILTDYRVIICATSVFSQYWYCAISKVSKLALCGVSEGWKHFEKGSSWSSLVSGSAILSRWMWSASITLSCQSLQYFKAKVLNCPPLT